MRVQVHRIISGGQTGADRAALDAAIAKGIATGGWCPAGRKAEDGVIPEKYPLTETIARNYAVRTRWNVRDAEGTLILNLGELDGGTLETLLIAQKTGKPCLVVQLDQPDHQHRQQVITWLREHSIHILNIAGPRESKRPGTYRQSYTTFLKDLLKNYLEH